MPVHPALTSFLHQRAEGQGLSGVTSVHMNCLNSLPFLTFQPLMQKAVTWRAGEAAICPHFPSASNCTPPKERPNPLAGEPLGWP
jgi:hypothetical protein